MAFYMLCDEVREEVASGSPYVRPEVLLHRLESRIEVTPRQMVQMLEEMTLGAHAILQIEVYVDCPRCENCTRVDSGQGTIELGNTFVCGYCGNEFELKKRHFKTMFKATTAFAEHEAQKKRA